MTMQESISGRGRDGLFVTREIARIEWITDDMTIHCRDVRHCQFRGRDGLSLYLHLKCGCDDDMTVSTPLPSISLAVAPSSSLRPITHSHTYYTLTLHYQLSAVKPAS